MYLEHRLSALLQLHLHSRLNIWLQYRFCRRRHWNGAGRGNPSLRKTKLLCLTADNLATQHHKNLIIMMTSSNGSIFRVTGPLCGEFTGPGEFPAQRPVTRSFDVFFDLRVNKRLSKQPRGWWLETPSWSLWRHRNDDLNLPEYSGFITSLCLLYVLFVH